jgi:hypothetical protein
MCLRMPSRRLITRARYRELHVVVDAAPILRIIQLTSQPVRVAGHLGIEGDGRRIGVSSYRHSGEMLPNQAKPKKPLCSGTVAVFPTTTLLNTRELTLKCSRSLPGRHEETARSYGVPRLPLRTVFRTTVVFTWLHGDISSQPFRKSRSASSTRARAEPIYAVRNLFPGDVAYVWHAGIYAGEVAASILAERFQIRGQIIWRKQHFAISRGAYHWQHEPCWYAVRKGKSARWCGDRTQSTVWDVQNLNPHGGNHDEKPTGHGTQKPVEIMRRPILNHTQRGEIVYDPFLGSGTTLIAAEMADRICYGIEIDPRYCDVIVRRWQEFTSSQATLDGHGATFEQVQQERRTQSEKSTKEEVLATPEADA